MYTCQTYYQPSTITIAYDAHGALGGASTWARGGNFSIGFASGAVASSITSCTEDLVDKLPTGWKITCMVAAGGLSGGVTASMAGGSFWEGVCNGLICSGLNHALHMIAGPDDPPGKEQNKPEPDRPWDENGDGKLQKIEADHWWINGRGESISVDNNLIDWSGLYIPEGATPDKIFAINTHEAFLIFPLETARTYGGTSFRVIDSNTVEVQDQKYHYNMRPWNNKTNIIRNIMTKAGKPISAIKGVDYIIHYENPIINISK